MRIVSFVFLLGIVLVPSVRADSRIDVDGSGEIVTAIVTCEAKTTDSRAMAEEESRQKCAIELSRELIRRHYLDLDDYLKQKHVPDNEWWADAATFYASVFYAYRSERTYDISTPFHLRARISFDSSFDWKYESVRVDKTLISKSTVTAYCATNPSEDKTIFVLSAATLGQKKGGFEAKRIDQLVIKGRQ